jgi:hypothetical protein
MTIAVRCVSLMRSLAGVLRRKPTHCGASSEVYRDRDFDAASNRIDTLCLICKPSPVERGIRCSLNGVVRPEHLLAVGELNRLERLTAGMGRRKRNVPWGMPVLGDVPDRVCKATRRFIPGTSFTRNGVGTCYSRSRALASPAWTPLRISWLWRSQ